MAHALAPRRPAADARRAARPLPPGARICVVLLTGLGDVVHGLPVVNALRRHDPTCHITWVVEPMPAGVLAHHPAVDEVVVYEKRRGWRGVLALRRRLAAARFDVVLNLNVYFKSLWPTLFAGAPRRVGFGGDRARDGVWLAANDPLAPRPRAHTQDMFLEFLDHLGVPRGPLEWRITFTEQERAAQAAFFARFGGRPVAALVPASAMPKKDWLPERFAAVADALAAEYGMAVMLVGGPSAREAAVAEEIERRAAHAPVRALGDGVRRMMWLIAGSRLVVAPDTGPAHVARAFGVPVVGLFGHTNPWRLGPYRAFEDLWVDRYTEPGAEPDPADNRPKLGCMERITTADVLARVARALERYPQPTEPAR